MRTISFLEWNSLYGVMHERHYDQTLDVMMDTILFGELNIRYTKIIQFTWTSYKSIATCIKN